MKRPLPIDQTPAADGTLSEASCHVSEGSNASQVPAFCGRGRSASVGSLGGYCRDERVIIFRTCCNCQYGS